MLHRSCSAHHGGSLRPSPACQVTVRQHRPVHCKAVSRRQLTVQAMFTGRNMGNQIAQNNGNGNGTGLPPSSPSGASPAPNGAPPGAPVPPRGPGLLPPPPPPLVLPGGGPLPPAQPPAPPGPGNNASLPPPAPLQPLPPPPLPLANSQPMRQVPLPGGIGHVGAPQATAPQGQRGAGLIPQANLAYTSQLKPPVRGTTPNYRELTADQLKEEVQKWQNVTKWLTAIPVAVFLYASNSGGAMTMPYVLEFLKRFPVFALSSQGDDLRPYITLTTMVANNVKTGWLPAVDVDKDPRKLKYKQNARAVRIDFCDVPWSVNYYLSNFDRVVLSREPQSADSKGLAAKTRFAAQTLPEGVKMTGLASPNNVNPLRFVEPKGSPTLADMAASNKLTLPGAYTLWPPDLTLPRHEQRRLMVIPMRKSSMLYWATTEVTDKVAGKLQTLVIAHIDCGDPTYASRELELIYQRASALEDLLSKQGIQVELQSTNALPDGTGGPQGTQRPPVLCPAGSWENSMLSPMHINNLEKMTVIAVWHDGDNVKPGGWRLFAQVHHDPTLAELERRVEVDNKDTCRLIGAAQIYPLGYAYESTPNRQIITVAAALDGGMMFRNESYNNPDYCDIMPGNPDPMQLPRFQTLLEKFEVRKITEQCSADLLRPAGGQGPVTLTIKAARDGKEVQKIFGNDFI